MSRETCADNSFSKLITYFIAFRTTGAWQYETTTINHEAFYIAAGFTSGYICINQHSQNQVIPAFKQR